MDLSARCKTITDSITLAIDAKAKSLKASGVDVVGFGAGEPDFDTPNFIKNAAKEALDTGKTKYTPAAGTVELRQAICKKLKDQNSVDYKPAQIVVSNGAKHSLFNVFQCIVNPGDEVIIPSPYWVSYPEMVKMAGGVPVFAVATEAEKFMPSVETIKKTITPKTRAIIMNSPSNPCGAVMSKDTMQKIVDICVEKGIYIVSDEIYEELIYDGNVHVSPASLGEKAKDITIIVNGFSKAYAMTGWRMGYTASNDALAKAMAIYQSHATSNPSSISQHASVAALTGPRDEIVKMVKEFEQRRILMYDLINAIPGVSCIKPEGAFYIMANISKTFGKSLDGTKITDSMTFCDALLDSEKVAVVPGIAFGADDFIRLSYATSRANIEKGIKRIAEFCAKLK